MRAAIEYVRWMLCWFIMPRNFRRTVKLAVHLMHEAKFGGRDAD